MINTATQRMQSIYNRKREIFLSMTKLKSSNIIAHAPLKQEIENDYRHLVYELAHNLSTIPIREIQDPMLQRQVQRLSKLQLHGLTDSDYEEAKKIQHSFQVFVTSPLVCNASHTDDCHRVGMPGITANSMRSRVLNDLKYYWKKWRDEIGYKDRAKTNFINYVRLLRTAAMYNGEFYKNFISKYYE